MIFYTFFCYSKVLIVVSVTLSFLVQGVNFVRVMVKPYLVIDHLGYYQCWTQLAKPFTTHFPIVTLGWKKMHGKPECAMEIMSRASKRAPTWHISIIKTKSL